MTTLSPWPSPLRECVRFVGGPLDGRSGWIDSPAPEFVECPKPLDDDEVARFVDAAGSLPLLERTWAMLVYERRRMGDGVIYMQRNPPRAIASAFAVPAHFLGTNP